MNTSHSLAWSSWTPHPTLGAQLVGIAPFCDDLLPATGVNTILNQRTTATQAFGPWGHSPRCNLCNTDAPSTFLLYQQSHSFQKDGTVRHYALQAPWTCLNCHKRTKAIDTSPLSAHQALLALRHTHTRIPLVLKDDLVDADGWMPAHTFS